MELKALTWNTQWASPAAKRTPDILRRIEEHTPDIACLTEVNDGLLSRDGHTITAGTDYGYGDQGRTSQGPALVEGALGASRRRGSRGLTAWPVCVRGHADAPGHAHRGRKSIDHIVLSEDLSSVELHVISNYQEGVRLSDHFGVAAAITA